MQLRRRYNRSEAMAPSREIGSFECAVCGVTIEAWNAAWCPCRLLYSEGWTVSFAD